MSLVCIISDKKSSVMFIFVSLHAICLCFLDAFVCLFCFLDAFKIPCSTPFHQFDYSKTWTDLMYVYFTWASFCLLVLEVYNFLNQI